MRAVKADLESALGSHHFGIRERHPSQTLPTGLPSIDILTGGLPRGAVTELFGAASSGRTSLVFAVLAEACRAGETCAYIDLSDAFDPVSADAAGIDLGRLLWVRCRGQAGHAMQAADLLLHAGGFGLVVLDLADIGPRTANAIPIPAWYRLRRAIEGTPGTLIVLSREPVVKNCAALLLQTTRNGVVWNGKLLRAADLRVTRKKPPRPAAATFRARAWG